MDRRAKKSAGVSRRDALKLLGVGTGVVASIPGASAAGQTARRGGSPSGSIVRTVLADVPPNALGAGHALFHEHLNVRDLGEEKLLDAEGRSDDTIIAELRASAAEGLRCIVDAATSRRSEAQVARVKKLAGESGIPIVMAGGYYL